MKITKKTVLASVAAVFAALTMVVALPAATFATGDGGESESSSQDSGGNGAAKKAKSGFDDVSSKVGAETDLTASIGTILTAVYSIVGVIAVVMVILGGINYATSQGDAGKVKKGKDTILYGIIGLVIVLLAFAITNFVLEQLTK